MSVKKQWVKNTNEMLNLAASAKGHAAKTAVAKCIYEYLCSSDCDDMVNHPDFVTVTKNNGCQLFMDEESLWEPLCKLAMCRFPDDIEFFENLALLRDWHRVKEWHHVSFDLEKWSELDDFQAKRDLLVIRNAKKLRETLKEHITAAVARCKARKANKTGSENKTADDITKEVSTTKEVSKPKTGKRKTKIETAPNQSSSDDEEKMVAVKNKDGGWDIMTVSN